MTTTPPVKIPRVARPRKRLAVIPVAVGLGLLGTGVFAKLVDARTEREDAASALPSLQAVPSAPAAQPAKVEIPAAGIQAIPNAPVVLTATPPMRSIGGGPARLPGTGAFIAAPADSGRSRAGAPTLIVDLAQSRSFDRFAARTASDGGDGGTFQTAVVADPSGNSVAVAGATNTASGTLSGTAVQSGSPATNGLSANERFAERAGGKEIEVSRAVAIDNLDRMVMQGTVVGAVMETALNSDLPGFARAVISRDVLSFDGSTVLIPAGSRVIGEYNSGIAEGASRIFIVWNRLIRPDGVSITLASPAVDDLGRGGLGGKVNRHFLRKYGSAILLSVLTGGLSALAQSRSNGSTVIVSNSSQATSLANQAQGNDIAPTIKTKQGALVRIFVSRDLDFSAVGPSR